MNLDILYPKIPFLRESYYGLFLLLLQNVADQESADEGRDPLPRELRARFHLTEGEGEEAAPMRRGGSIEKLDEFARVPHMGPGLDFSHDLQGGAVIFEMIIGKFKEVVKVSLKNDIPGKLHQLR